MKNSRIAGKPHFDAQRAADMVGKVVLIGLMYYDHEGNFVEQKQMHGKIVSAEANRGFQVELEGSHKGETYWIPPDTRGFRKAKPGEYRELSTGETVVDPDFLSTWEIRNPPPDFQADKQT